MSKLKKIIHFLYKNIYSRLFKNIYISFLSYVDRETELEGDNVIRKFSKISKSTIGRFTYIGENCELVKTKIGNYSSLGKDIKVIRGFHPTDTFVSTYPLFYSKKSNILNKIKYTLVKEEKFIDDRVSGDYYVVIGNDVWIGNEVKIMSGVEIGDGSIVGTGAVVTSDIPPYSIHGGVPSKEIRKRFDEKIISFLLDFKWWNKEKEWINKNYMYFDDVYNFYEKFKDDIYDDN